MDLKWRVMLDMRKYLILILCLILLTTAVFAGFYIVRTVNAGKENGSGKISKEDISAVTDEPQRIVTRNGFSELIYEVDQENGTVDLLTAVILSPDKKRLDLITIGTDISYTMSRDLYTKLTPENVTLPQTVITGGIYGYYHSDRAFDAGRQIIGEMLGYGIEKSAVFSTGGFDEYEYRNIRDCAGAAVYYHEVPVIRHNEATLPDTDGIAGLMYDIIGAE